MIKKPDLSRQPRREAWMRERLLRERAIAIACAVEPSSVSSYSSAVKSYFDFCSSHSLPVEPTPDTLSFYAVYMAHHIKPKSVTSYLSGVCNQLEPFFPDIRSHRQHWLVTKTFAGCRKMFPSATTRKRPITRAELAVISHSYLPSPSYDNALFLALLLTGFHGLMRLGELTWPDNKNLQDYRKVTMRSSVQTNSTSFEFLLPGHKADRFFEGSRIIIQSTKSADDARGPFTKYLSCRDRLFPLRPELYLRENGTIPTRAWFIHRLRQHFPAEVGGQSLRAGGATALAEAGIPSQMIQAIGRWSSEAFQITFVDTLFSLPPFSIIRIYNLTLRLPSKLHIFSLSNSYLFHSLPPFVGLLAVARNSISGGAADIRALPFSATRLHLRPEQVVRSV